MDDVRRNRLSYAYEKLSAAVYELATNPHHMKARLHAAWEPFVLARCSEYPPAQQELYQRVFDRLTKIPVDEFAKTAIGASLKRMRFSTASNIAKDICRLESEVESLLREIDMQSTVHLDESGS